MPTPANALKLYQSRHVNNPGYLDQNKKIIFPELDLVKKYDDCSTLFFQKT